MGDKILVEFDKKNLNYLCAKYCKWFELCQQTNINMIECILRYPTEINFKLKEQNNGNKGTED